jgi:hypothetical protein
MAGNDVIVNCTGIANQQTTTITLTNVASGQQTGDITVPMAVLLGDTTGNRAVNSTDIAQVKAGSGLAATAETFRRDVSVNGDINATDISVVKSVSGTSAP